MRTDPPTRADVEAWWRDVLSGTVSREASHEWAEPLMFAEYDSDAKPDRLAMFGVQYLHGFDMTSEDAEHRLVAHGPPGDYIKTMAEIEADMRRWLASCHEYDADPDD